jgi:riboflavin transporter FmnP
MTFRLFGREPALFIAVITSAVLLIGTMNLRWISGDQAGFIVAAIVALAAAAMAWTTRPLQPALFTGVVGAVVAVLAAYNFNLPAETVAGINSLLITVLALLTRGQVAPQETAVSRA